MPIVSLDLVTLELIRECGAIYIEDSITCRILRKDKRRVTDGIAANEAKLLLGDLRIQIDELTAKAFEEVRAELITLGVQGPWEEFERPEQ